MSGGWGILGSGGLRQKVTPRAMDDLSNYVHKLAKNSLQMDSDGNVDISGILNIATTGELQQGTGTLGVDFNGLRIWNDSGVGRIAGYNSASTDPQWYADTDGKLYAGGGVFWVDSSGPTVKVDTADSDIAAYRIVKTDGVLTGKLTATFQTTLNDVYLVGQSITGADTYVSLISNAPSAKTAAAVLNAISSTGLNSEAATVIAQALFGGPSGIHIRDAGLVVGSTTFFNSVGGAAEGSIVMSGGLNVGTATGATAGQIKTSDDIIIADGKNLEWSDVVLSRGAANRLDLASGDLLYITDGEIAQGVSSKQLGTQVVLDNDATSSTLIDDFEFGWVHVIEWSGAAISNSMSMQAAVDGNTYNSGTIQVAIASNALTIKNNASGGTRRYMIWAYWSTTT